MKWLTRLLFPGAYDQGHQDGFKEGYWAGQVWGHEHGQCEHSHPFDGAMSKEPPVQAEAN